MEWTLLTIFKKNCKCFYVSLLKASACLPRWPEFLFHFCQNRKTILKYLLLFMNILKIYRLLLEEFTALLHNLTVISKAALSIKKPRMVHLLQYHPHTKKAKQNRGEGEGRKHYKQDLLCLTLNLNHQPNFILIYSFYICNLLEHSAGVLINNSRNRLGQANFKVFWCICLSGQDKKRYLVRIDVSASERRKEGQ